MELLTETPPLLKEGHIVHFSKEWNDDWSEKFFKVVKAKQVEYDVNRILSPGSANIKDVSFEAPQGGGVSSLKISLLPVGSKTMYEILIGIKGTPKVYPRYRNKYFLDLEETGCIPDPSDVDLSALGFYDSEKSPWYAPRVREYTVVNQEPPHLLLFNPFQDDEKIVLNFIVNQCLLAPVQQASGIDAKVAREVNYHKVLTW